MCHETNAHPPILELPIAWTLATIGTLATTIATLAAIMWAFMKSRLAAQDTIIDGSRSPSLSCRTTSNASAKAAGTRNAFGGRGEGNA